jgi:hypothetical protein
VSLYFSDGHELARRQALMRIIEQYIAFSARTVGAMFLKAILCNAWGPKERHWRHSRDRAQSCGQSKEPLFACAPTFVDRFTAAEPLGCAQSITQ